MSTPMIGFDDVDEGNEFTPPETFARDNLEFMAFEDTGLKHEDLFSPTTWRVLIFPKQPKKMTAGGIALPDQVQDVEKHLTYIGQVVAMGPLAGKNERFQNPDWDDVKDSPSLRHRVPSYLWNVKVGDWVCYGRHAGMHCEFRGFKFLLVNDDDITAVLKGPEGFRVYL